MLKLLRERADDLGLNVTDVITSNNPAYAKAKAAWDSNNLESARPLLEAVVREDPRNAEAWQLLGSTKQLSNDPEGALAAFENSLAIIPTRSSVMFSRARALERLGRFEEAAEQLEKMIALLTLDLGEAGAVKGSPFIWFAMVELKLKQRDWATAISGLNVTWSMCPMMRG